MTPHSFLRHTRRAALLALGIIGSHAMGARAQEVRSGNGFLLGTPVAHLGLSAGWAFANANSDLFAEKIEQLTLTKGDFSGPAANAEFGFRLGSRIDFVLDVSYMGTSAQSEFRKFVDNNDQPIEQTTTFQRVPVTAGLKVYLASRGRSIGNLAWIPARVVPWIGAGGGSEWYRFRQTGDFVNFQNNNVFASTLTTSASSPVALGMAGIDMSLNPRVFGTFDARYSWAKGDVHGSYSGYDKLDLSGITASVGLSVRL